MKTQRILVSACLLGHAVRYDGRSKPVSHQLLDRWMAEGRIVMLCPEMAAGLPVPRPPAEIEPGGLAADVLEGRARVMDSTGADVTGDFVAGADIALDLARRTGCRFALLTDGSPSCGSGTVYTGRFDGTRQDGEGVVASRLRGAGIAVFPESRIEELAEMLAGYEVAPEH
ncbi:DUF523 domain-containing protein [Pseudohoeflea suaedae]|uniref:DUF523 domain-containing protein n=1 Tax=Pseudohoeflea suaedae TaxID=877384 RepID=A0A4R5PJL2_9HYPH|nr:DUF523 domain-containing protein [Pseudohoeflea suaedae]TDH35765.1 DUF523 domain-containing protein [Pseudohoeflea suaedae]